jgi:hypothetical protein
MMMEIENKLRENQAGFRAKRSCTDHIATLRIIIEQSIEWNSGLCLNFIDCKQAFDTVDRTKLWELMVKYGFPTKFVNITKAFYEGNNLRIVNQRTLTDKFE